MKPGLGVILAGSLAATAAEDPLRSSADYAIRTEVLDFGGRTVTSADYTIIGSLAPITENSGDGPSGTFARGGFVGQLHDRIGLGLIASEPYPPETGSTRFTAVHANDDGTSDPIPGTAVAWVVVGGPITNIDAAGVARTGTVLGNTEARVRGTVFGTALELSVFVQDALHDNFGAFAGDGLPDAWQDRHFGTNPLLAGPDSDPDGDGQDNRFEYAAGLDPADPSSRFRLRIEPVPGQPNHKRLVFGPAFPDRRYTILFDSEMTGAGIPLPYRPDDPEATERGVTDLDAVAPSRFYRVEITGP